MNLLYFNKAKYEKIIKKLSSVNIFVHNFWKPIHKQNMMKNFKRKFEYYRLYV